MNTQPSIAAHTSAAKASASLMRSVSIGIAAALATAVLTTVGAKIFIPLYPVPITLQTLFVMLAGTFVGSRRGALGQSSYVLAGGLGLPIFAGSVAGFGVIAGPTGGFLLSFAVVPFIVGAMIHRSSKLTWQIGVFSLATAVIFVLGLTHLTLFYTHDFTTSLSVGFYPFIPGALFKIAAAVSIHRSYHALRRQWRTAKD